MLRRLLLLFCSACLVVGVGAAIGGGMGSAQVGGCFTPTPSPTASPNPTPTVSPAPCDTAPPTCRITAVITGPPKQMQVTARDIGSGIQMITNVVFTNANVSWPAFTPGTTSPVVLTATKLDQTQNSIWSFDVIDMAGNVKHCT